MLIALGANYLASAMTGITIDLMRSRSDFAEAVRVNDLRILRYYQPIAYFVATTIVVAYLWPIFTYFRCDPSQAAPPVVQRRSINAPAAIAAIGLLPWVLNSVVYPAATVLHFGTWKPELASQQILSPVVNGFLAATTTFLLLDWLFRAMVLPRVFPAGRLVEVPGSWAPGVRARLLIFLIAVAFVPLFTMLGLIRAAAMRIESGADTASIVPALTHAGEMTFAVYLAVGMAFTMILARTFTQPLTEIAGALRPPCAAAISRRGCRRPPATSSACCRTASTPWPRGCRSASASCRRSAASSSRQSAITCCRATCSSAARSGSSPCCSPICAASPALGERLPPSEVVSILNQYFSAIRDLGARRGRLRGQVHRRRDSGRLRALRQRRRGGSPRRGGRGPALRARPALPPVGSETPRAKRPARRRWRRASASPAARSSPAPSAPRIASSTPSSATP
jgi:hypothetical protein